jgi:phosphocarrier protein
MALVKKKIKVQSSQGLHARPAALFVRTASQVDSDIQVSNGEAEVSGKSLWGVLTLEASRGAILTVTAEGPDAQEALDALEKLVYNKFFEDGPTNGRAAEGNRA